MDVPGEMSAFFIFENKVTMEFEGFYTCLSQYKIVKKKKKNPRLS